MRALFGAVSCSLMLLSCDYKPKNQGKALYNAHCMSCHMDEGEGLGALFPPLANADYLLNDPSVLPCIIRNGVEGSMTVNGQLYDGKMSGNSSLTEAEISNLVYYILVELNKQETAPNIKEIREMLDGCD